MKQTIRLFLVALVAGATTLGGYKWLVEAPHQVAVVSTSENPNYIPTNYAANTAMAAGIDFTDAAQKSVHAVVHVKNTTVSRQPTNMMDLFFGGGSPRAMIGTGSGVIISPDGYIITNNHVIENAVQLEVTLNNNKTYKAEIIGSDSKTDIALIKIDADDDLPFIPFADSNNVKVGEWVLAVGNPFNLTSTVTAGIVSAKARDLNEFDSNPQSFIQTDAAVNRGNSGGALVNTQGQLVGINTAITSETGSYVGYSFAVPSNTARKVVEDIMEYGNVQRAMLGITGGSLDSRTADQVGVSETEGIYVSSVEKGSGADKGGIQKGDIIKKIDGFKMAKFSDLSGYLGSKRPDDIVNVTILRGGDEKVIPVTLVKLEVYQIDELGLEVKNINTSELKSRGVKHGVKVSRALTPDMQRYNLEGIIITEINDESVETIDDIKNAMNHREYNEPIKLTFVNQQGETHSFIFR
ncbi:MAG TPA: trypsin-like peptidase domain-containing protein [Flavobacteriaceae bacterium]|nr:trypsin-like peptidase domain-containing protein [Flavobacteriaceae bacterium]MCB9214140.1 trypsin-like peptidase domain-containing protein [Alteromonas sp.]HPF11957.1 trypsin-like peptidase domain-containing protein [Flavobacteriaceae bacterium]HQU22060.1 trypsin-like peptidase domain-containing protein [Flavobacteriaceae bacterium]HQU65411.1 trypsin-like peptidase domain-containing protein [Flavobacteriaceae bacterium]